RPGVARLPSLRPGGDCRGLRRRASGSRAEGPGRDGSTPLSRYPFPGRGGKGLRRTTMLVAEPWTKLAQERLLWMYDRMSLIREFEERLKALIDRGLPVGSAHYYTGEEAVAVGVCAALRETDWIASTHRGHGHCIAKNVDVRPMMAEL